MSIQLSKQQLVQSAIQQAKIVYIDENQPRLSHKNSFVHVHTIGTAKALHIADSSNDQEVYVRTNELADLLGCGTLVTPINFV